MCTVHLPLFQQHYDQSYLSLVTCYTATSRLHLHLSHMDDYPESTWTHMFDTDPQLISPLFQGMFWGVAGVLLSTTAASLRTALYPPSHTPRGRITGGPGGKLEGAGEAGGGEAVGGPWWRKFVGSWAGAVETATA